jgi:hypothetical protein
MQEGGDMVPLAGLAGKKTSLRISARCLLFDTPIDLIGGRINQTFSQTTFHVETR